MLMNEAGLAIIADIDRSAAATFGRCKRTTGTRRNKYPTAMSFCTVNLPMAIAIVERKVALLVRRESATHPACYEASSRLLADRIRRSKEEHRRPRSAWVKTESLASVCVSYPATSRLPYMLAESVFDLRVCEVYNIKMLRF